MKIRIGDLVRLNSEYDEEAMLIPHLKANIGIVTELHETFACAWVMFGTLHVRYNERALEVINESPTFISQ